MDFFNGKFPGNLSAIDRMLSAMAEEGVIAFTGSGTSMPSLPSWTSLIDQLISCAQSDGKMDSKTADALRAEKDDILYVVDEIYSCSGETDTKIKVAEIFKNLHSATEVQEFIVECNFTKFMTLNYDIGLELAFSNKFGKHLGSVTTKNEHEFRKWLSSGPSDRVAQVLHWHGIATDLDSIVLSSADYSKLYHTAGPIQPALRDVFQRERCALIGFGFTDPFILGQLNSIMQPLKLPNMHFAIIGVSDIKKFNCELARRKYQTKYKLEPIFYEIYREDANPHRELATILAEIRDRRSRLASARNPSANSVENINASLSNDNANDPLLSRASLFEIDGRKIYCEPNLYERQVIDDAPVESLISVSDVVSSLSNYVISAPHEYGLTTLGKRICSEIRTSGRRAALRGAESIPNYKKKILKDREINEIINTREATLIIDNFSPIDHQRMLKELFQINEFARIIILQKSTMGDEMAGDSLDDQEFTYARLDGLKRSNIREIIRTVAPSLSSDLTSRAVDRVYVDLLQLCIPLTPSNVIMYSTILIKDGDFVPVSRLHIVEKFVSDALQRASDIYSDSFNYVDKVELFSSFCYKLFCDGHSSFDIPTWNKFCSKFRRENMIEFNHTEIIGDLAGGRIIYRDGGSYYFRYRMFFSYFIGKKIGSSQDLLQKCLDEDKHMELDGLVEVICGTVPDCSEVVENIEGKLSTSIEAFYAKYPISNFDFHAGRKWMISGEEDALWDRVSEVIDGGPTGTAELDELKSSIFAERRTDNQKISIIKFIASEQSVSRTAILLRLAIEGAKYMSPEVKISAVSSVVNGYRLAYEVANVFSPLIAEKKYVSWNGFVYINLIEGVDEEGKETALDRMTSLVIQSLPSSVTADVITKFGSRKVGLVFLHLFQKTGCKGIEKLFYLGLILKSKPSGWLDIVTSDLKNHKKDDIYLRHFLGAAMNQIKNEINSSREVLQIKEYIAAIRLRRDANVKTASKSQIDAAILKLESKDYFER